MRVPAFGTLPPGKNSLAAAGERANTSLRKPNIDAFLLLNIQPSRARRIAGASDCASGRSEEHTSELQSLMRISYAVFCLKKKKINQTHATESYINITKLQNRRHTNN